MALTHVITVGVGEDIAAKIFSFSQQMPRDRALRILTASGAVSTVTFDQGTVTHEGCFEILFLSGSYSPTDEDASHNRTGRLSIICKSHDEPVICGKIGGALIAASDSCELYTWLIKDKEHEKELSEGAVVAMESNNKSVQNAVAVNIHLST
ncbi:hypothetical protein RIF29_15566 [Crotalaria pallida]|uniref:AT-hook motif nuclear-localized protein n=1 Tax=Crotalaria pallida TaxID=3830 RepID=A0AAN9FF19_CROPI